MPTLRAGVLGLGYAGLEHAKAYAANPRTELVAIATRSPERLAAAQEEAPAQVATTSYDEVLARDDVDVVSIATPDRLHAEQIVAALGAGKHVLAEKPLCTSIDEARAIIAATERSGRKLLCGQILRFAPYFRTLKKIIDEGDVGKPFYVEADYLHDLTPFFAQPSWRTDPARPQNMVLGGGCHPVDLLRWMFGEVACVYAVGVKKSMAEQPFPHDTVLMSLTFTSGMIGKVLVSVGCKRPYQLNFGVYGTRGTLLNNRLFLDKLDGLQDFMEMPLAIPEEFPHYAEEIDHIIDCIMAEERPLVDARDAAQTVAVCIAAIWSIERGGVVAVPEV